MHKSFGATIDQLINISLFNETENGIGNPMDDVSLNFSYAFPLTSQDLGTMYILSNYS